ncbi:hypothetical protein P170DRAFT_513596, partial [Aspergillus steynii IBT 23096]
MAHRVRRRQQLDRVANACEPCKKRKTKCSGKNPCEPCIARQVECIFREAEKKILVSESYLRELQQIYASMHSGSNHDSTHEEQRPAPEADIPSRDVTTAAEEQITNPLVSTTSFYLRETSGYYRFCGPSSTWSFSQRIFLLLKNELPGFPAPDLPFHIDGSTWELKWSRASLDNISMLEGLPSLSDSLYLLNVVKFHCYHMLFLYDEDEFIPHLHELYEKGVEKAKAMPLWFVQYLLIIAVAKALLAASRGPRSPPGAAFFERAMSLMPDFVEIHRHPNLGMQVSYLAGFYLISVDMKDAAYAYIGQALRMCMIEGLYRDPPNDIFGIKFANQCRNIWWTTYILERQISAMIGAPCSVQDAEVTCSLPVSYDNSEMALVLTMHAKLSRILGDILNSVYTADNRRRRSFISTVQSVLRDMAHILRDIEDIFADTAHPSLRTLSTTSSHLYLRYHQCIILATRPLFLYLLINRLKKSPHSREDDDTSIPSQLRPLLEASVQSAKISIRTLSLLHEQSSLEPFLPFDLDSLFSAAFIIILAGFIDVCLIPDLPSYITAISRMLNEFIAKGNMAAQMRKKELDLLQHMTQQILVNEGSKKDGGGENVNSDLGQEITADLDGEEWLLADEDIGMSYTQVLSLAQQLDTVDGSV